MSHWRCVDLTLMDGKALTFRLTPQQSQVLEALRAVVANFFTDTAVLKYGLYDPVAGLNKVFGAMILFGQRDRKLMTRVW